MNVSQNMLTRGMPITSTKKFNTNISSCYLIQLQSTMVKPINQVKLLITK